MICLEIINLLLENKYPEILAQKLYDVQGISESWLVLRKSVESYS
jgi:hypothetical protein